MEIKIGRSTFAVEFEDLAPLPDSRPGLRLFTIAPKALDGPELIRLAFKTGSDENLYRTLWATLHFGFCFPIETWPRSFDPLSLVNAYTGRVFREQFLGACQIDERGDMAVGPILSSLKKFVVRDSLMRLMVWANDPLAMKGDRLVYWQALYRETPLPGLEDIDWGPDAEIWPYFQRLVLEQFPPKFLEAQRAKGYRRQGVLEEVRPADWRDSIHFQAVRALCERMVFEFEDRIARLAYRAIHGDLSRRERRLFVFTQMRQPFLGGLIAAQGPLAPQLAGFLKMPSDLAGKPSFGNLWVLLTLGKRFVDSWGLKELGLERGSAWDNLADYLSDRFGRFLSALPWWHDFIERVNSQKRDRKDPLDKATPFDTENADGDMVAHEPGPFRVEVEERVKFLDPKLDPDVAEWIQGRNACPYPVDAGMVHKLLETHLTPQQAGIVFDRYYREMSGLEMAQKYHVSPAYISKTIKAALAKLRAPLEKSAEAKREQYHLPRWGYARRLAIKGHGSDDNVDPGTKYGPFKPSDG